MTAQAIGNDLIDCLKVLGTLSPPREAVRGQLVWPICCVWSSWEHDDASYIPAALKESPLAATVSDLAQQALA